MSTMEPPADGSPAAPEPDDDHVSVIRLNMEMKMLWLWFETRQVWKRYYLLESS